MSNYLLSFYYGLFAFLNVNWKFIHKTHHLTNGHINNEYNYQFKDGWRAAIFSDFGNAYDKQFSNPTEYSIGVGIRWRSPIGPIRLDVASGISNDNNPIRLHFFIGPQL
jgi:outer membrane translocation and assembly module TamA